jgi:hypothetical protein
MSTQSMLMLVDSAAAEAMRAASGTAGDAVRRQAAFVRALVDEVERVHSADREAPFLNEQLAEELTALSHLVHAG